MKLYQVIILAIFSICASSGMAQNNGDLSVSGATITNDLAIMALDCTANINGGALTTDADGIVVCSDDNGTTGPHTEDTTLSEGQVDAFVANNGYSTGAHTVDTDTTCSLSACIDPGHATLTCGATSIIMNCIEPGASWTARSARVATANNWASVTYGNGIFVAVAHQGETQVMTSPDGTTWTARAAAEAKPWEGVTYGDGMLVAVGPGGTNQVMTSPGG